jgi:hypothetical protein
LIGGPSVIGCRTKLALARQNGSDRSAAALKKLIEKDADRAP